MHLHNATISGDGGRAAPEGGPKYTHRASGVRPAAPAWNSVPSALRHGSLASSLDDVLATGRIGDDHGRHREKR
jgi:hypothetical protein